MIMENKQKELYQYIQKYLLVSGADNQYFNALDDLMKLRTEEVIRVCAKYPVRINCNDCNRYVCNEEEFVKHVIKKYTKAVEAHDEAKN